jgi:hypothetical protein
MCIAVNIFRAGKGGNGGRINFELIFDGRCLLRYRIILAMDFYPQKLKRWLPVVALGAMTLSAVAQDAGQPIVFSAPLTADAPAAPNNAQPGILPTMQAPMSVLDFNQHEDFAPLPTTAVSSQQPQMNQLMKDRKNWILMTPEEILGLPEKTGKDALGHEKNQTQLERYLERENQARDGTIGESKKNHDSIFDLSRDPDKANFLDVRQNSEAAHNNGRPLNGQANHDDFVSDWSAFNRPVPQAAAKPDPEQLASMERFRQLLAPSPAPADAQTPNNQFFTAPKPVENSLITKPDFVPNPAGASFTPLFSGIGKPVGLTPLPDAVTSPLLPVAAPAWKPQLAPWLLSGPQPFVTPQQKGF